MLEVFLIYVSPFSQYRHIKNELKHLIVDWRLIKNISTLLPQRNAAKYSTGRYNHTAEVVSVHFVSAAV